MPRPTVNFKASDLVSYLLNHPDFSKTLEVTPSGIRAKFIGSIISFDQIAGIRRESGYDLSLEKGEGIYFVFHIQ